MAITGDSPSVPLAHYRQHGAGVLLTCVDCIDHRELGLEALITRLRSEPARSFSDCLKGAWAFTKRMAKTAAKFAAKARKGMIHFSPSLIRSPSTNRFAGQTYGRTYDRQAGVSISRVGR